jgi:hypothetical protein
MGTFVLTARGSFSLAASTRFLEGFIRRPTPDGRAASGDGFPSGRDLADRRCASARAPARNARSSAPQQRAGSCLRPRAQVARFLLLDVDGTGFPVGESDPVIALLHAGCACRSC